MEPRNNKRADDLALSESDAQERSRVRARTHTHTRTRKARDAPCLLGRRLSCSLATHVATGSRPRAQRRVTKRALDSLQLQHRHDLHRSSLVTGCTREFALHLLPWLRVGSLGIHLQVQRVRSKSIYACFRGWRLGASEPSHGSAQVVCYSVQMMSSPVPVQVCFCLCLAAMQAHTACKLLRIEDSFETRSA